MQTDYGPWHAERNLQDEVEKIPPEKVPGASAACAPPLLVTELVHLPGRYTAPVMSLPLTADPPPLATGDDDVVRVGGTRVTLDTVVDAFREGLTAEEIQQQYPALTLTHVYAAISYFLQHRAEVEAYLDARARRREEIRQEAEARFDASGIRERLLSRVRD
jgi:uncharacterized protein (DUF433 family)